MGRSAGLGNLSILEAALNGIDGLSVQHLVVVVVVPEREKGGNSGDDGCNGRGERAKNDYGLCDGNLDLSLIIVLV
jgi:hypothetical protein